ncbi:anti-sigma factor [Paenibacillus eucommiae]|uniref:Anti-sigma K factor RskA C-terminal domain-containing protein n=1 Tax=Paenibacillus eucommiae TaxID=1355755 RepID=A0ABS4J0A1_9BACL|nr:anti-sigma factor [Paenibacillus eucommiae]MBP1992755.1 hypothetical protein [Paenibacillus eucommiae]
MEEQDLNERKRKSKELSELDESMESEEALEEAVEEVVAEIKAHTSARIYPGFRNWSLVSVAIVMLILGGYMLGEQNGRSKVAEDTSVAESAQIPWELQKKTELRLVDPSVSKGAGNVLLMQRGESTQVVLHVSGLPATQSSESYRMWMGNEGKFWSGGSFLVNKDGEGMLLYTLTNGQVFSSVKITLEPDKSSNQPQGRELLIAP